MADVFDAAWGSETRDLVALVPRLRLFAQSLCHNAAQAEDLAQDALASAWAHRGRYAPGSNLTAWVFRILLNHYYSDRRRAWRTQPLDPRVAERTLVATSDPTAALELDDVRRAMRELTDDQREALMLVSVAGLSIGMAATVCGCAEPAIKSRVHRARLRLQTILSGDSLRDRSRVSGGVMASMIADAEHLRAGARANRSTSHFGGSQAGPARLYPQEFSQ